MKKKIFLLLVLCLIGCPDLFAPRTRRLWINQEQYSWYSGWAAWYRSIGVDPNDIDWTEMRYLMTSPGQTTDRPDPFVQFGFSSVGRWRARKSRLSVKLTGPAKEHRVAKAKKKQARDKKVAARRRGEKVLCSHSGCKVVFDSYRKYQIRDHQNMPTGSRPYECSYCGQGFAFRSSKRRHLRRQVCGALKR